MMGKILPLALAVGAVSSSALAEPVALTDAEMDRVTAGGADSGDLGGFFQLQAGEGVATVSVLAEVHQGQVEYALVEIWEDSLHVVAQFVTPTSEVYASDVVASGDAMVVQYTGQYSIMTGSGDATVEQNICFVCLNLGFAVTLNVLATASVATATTGEQVINVGYWQ
jgi:hypothetical protein